MESNPKLQKILEATRLFALLALFPLAASAQWLKFSTPGTPRTSDGQPDLAAPAPRTVAGKPDLTGTWMHEPTPLAEARLLFGKFVDDFAAVEVPGMEAAIQNKYALDLLVDLRPEEGLMRPEAFSLMQRRAAEQGPGGTCGGEDAGWPLMGLLSEPIKIVQAPQETIILYEAGNLHRQVFTDGREFPATFELPAYLGYSVGRWEDDTFIVETRGFNGKAPIDFMGHPRSEAMHVTERLHRRDFGHLDYEMTFDDPKFYTQKFTVKILHNLVADGDIFEMFCENEKDLQHLKKP